MYHMRMDTQTEEIKLVIEKLRLASDNLLSNRERIDSDDVRTELDLSIDAISFSMAILNKHII